MDSVKVGYFLLIFGILFISAAAASSIQLTDRAMILWENVTDNSQERYTDESGNYWYTYKVTIGADDSQKTAILGASIQDSESLSFRWKMDKIAENADLKFKVGTSTKKHCKSTDLSSDQSLVQGLSLNRDDNVEWEFTNLNPTISVQAWIAIPPEKGSISSVATFLPNTKLDTPSGPGFGYTNEEYRYSTNEIGHMSEVNYEFEFDGKPNSNLAERAEMYHKWNESGPHKIRVRAVTASDHKYSNWSDQRTVIIYDKIIFTKGDLKNKLANINNYTEMRLCKDFDDVGELVIKGKNNITIISGNGKIKLYSSVERTMKVINSTNISVIGIDILNEHGNGLELINCHHCNISNNEIKFRYEKFGISISGDDNVVEGNILENTTGTCMNFTDGIILNNGTNNIIENNTIQKPKNCALSTFTINTNGSFKIIVTNNNQLPIQLYKYPNTCYWFGNGTILCSDNNRFDIHKAEDNDTDPLIWSTFPAEPQP